MTADVVLRDLDTLYLEIEPSQQQEAWQHSQTLATDASGWRAYLNQLGFDALTGWLKAEGTVVEPALARPLRSSIWELMSGSAVNCLGARLILLVTEALDSDELCVPQSWVDIPSWTGDYYLLLQVNPDDGWVRFGGFATHRTLKEKGIYDWCDRSYRLNSTELTDDISTLLVSQSLYPEASKRAAIAPLQPLSITQARQLIERLGDTQRVLDPRLAIGFEQWGALVENSGWRRQLAERRWGFTQQSVRQWLQSGLEQAGQKVASEISGRLAGQLGWQPVFYRAAAVARDAGMASIQTVLRREIEIEGESYALQVAPLQAGENAWRFELTKETGPVPEGVVLELLSEDLQPFEGNRAIAITPVESLYIEVALVPEEGIVWKTEPASGQYEPEILRF